MVVMTSDICVCLCGCKVHLLVKKSAPDYTNGNKGTVVDDQSLEFLIFLTFSTHFDVEASYCHSGVTIDKRTVISSTFPPVTWYPLCLAFFANGDI